MGRETRKGNIMKTDEQVQKAAVVVAVGREIRQVPVGLDRWHEVREAARNVIHGPVFTEQAVGYGVWGGRSEESVTVSGEVAVDYRLTQTFDDARDLAEEHEQDAVAVTVGVTCLVGKDRESKPSRLALAKRLRDLADAIEADFWQEG